jgi:hypothetical protein
VQAIKEALADRPEPKDQAHAALVFVARHGQPWAKDSTDQTLAKEAGKLLRALHINGRKGLGFYTLRHTFRTVADEAKDQPAVDYIMGHEVPHMSSIYRETISDARLRAVLEHVRGWLFGNMPEFARRALATGHVRLAPPPCGDEREVSNSLARARRAPVPSNTQGGEGQWRLARVEPAPSPWRVFAMPWA